MRVTVPSDSLIDALKAPLESRDIVHESCRGVALSANNCSPAAGTAAVVRNQNSTLPTVCRVGSAVESVYAPPPLVARAEPPSAGRADGAPKLDEDSTVRAYPSPVASLPEVEPTGSSSRHHANG
jgi:hypothetical protein